MPSTVVGNNQVEFVFMDLVLLRTRSCFCFVGLSQPRNWSNLNSGKAANQRHPQAEDEPGH